MSHITTVTTQVRDAEAARLCYPVVFDLAKGTARYDNFEQRWGETAHLEKFLQRYAAEKVKIEARRRGHAVAEQQLADGSLKLTIQAGG